MISCFLPRPLGRVYSLLRQAGPFCSTGLTVRDLTASSGEIYIGGQEHFYLETHCTIAVPKGEAGEMELFVSTQNTMKTQVDAFWVSSRGCQGSGELLADQEGHVGNGKREMWAGPEGTRVS